MEFQCPGCGKPYTISEAPDAQTLFRCENPDCRRIFSMAEAMGISAAEEKKEQASPEAPAAGRPLPGVPDAAKALAQNYFGDIPGADESQIIHQAGAMEEQAPINAELQRQQLFQYAKEHQNDGAKSDAAVLKPEKRPVRQVKVIREQKNQCLWSWILVPLAFAIEIIRIVATDLTAGLAQFSRMQAQIIPSALYFLAAVDLIFHLLRRTYKPQRVAAALLLLPLILDMWYLIPALMDALPAGLWFTVNSCVKLLFSIFGLVMSIRAAKYPAKKYRAARG